MELIQKLRERRDEIGICSPLEEYPDIFEDMGCRIYPIRMSRHGKNPLAEVRLLRDITQVLKDFRPDIVLAYTIKPNIYGSVACNRLGIPIITSVTGLGSAVENAGFMQKISIRLLRWGMKDSNHVYFQNAESLEFFNSHKIKLRSKSLIAGSGVNLSRFKLAPYPSLENPIRFLYTGRILEAKGIGLYLEAAKIIKERYPQTEFHIVGIKDDIKYSSLVDEYSAKGIITFHGYQRDPRGFITGSHCQVHPTFYPEGMSNVLLESAAMGRPAITTDRSGCKEIVDDGVTGFIIPQQNQSALIDAIERFVNLSHIEKEAMGLRAHEKVATHFDRAKVVEEYITKIEELTSVVL